MSGSNFGSAKCKNSDFAKSNLSGADFRGADLENVDFRGANLNGATLRGAKLLDVNFSGANLTGVSFDGDGDLSRTQFRNVKGLSEQAKEQIRSRGGNVR